MVENVWKLKHTSAFMSWDLIGPNKVAACTGICKWSNGHEKLPSQPDHSGQNLKEDCRKILVLKMSFFLTQTQSLSEFCQSSSFDIHWLCIIELRSWRLSILQGSALFPSTSHNQKIDFQHFVGVWSSYPCHFLKAWKHISKICLAVHPSNLKLAFLPDIWCFDMVMDTFGVLPKTHQLCPSWQTGL